MFSYVKKWYLKINKIKFMLKYNLILNYQNSKYSPEFFIE